MLIFNVEIDKDNLPVRDIIRFAETQAVTTNVVKEYIIMLLLTDENVLSHVCEEKLTVSHSLRKVALNDIKQLME